jgi:hypothetical protein
MLLPSQKIRYAAVVRKKGTSCSISSNYLLVLLGLRQSITSLLRQFVLPMQGGSTRLSNTSRRVSCTARKLSETLRSFRTPVRIPTNPTYVMHTGVRKDLSVSLNFRAVHDTRRDVGFYFNYLLVLLGYLLQGRRIRKSRRSSLHGENKLSQQRRDRLS